MRPHAVKYLHHFLLAALTIVLALWMASTASAMQGQPATQTQTQSTPPTKAHPGGTDQDITRRELRNFDRYLDAHPEVAQELRKDPNLINNPDWVNKHPELKEWLAKHPHARGELKEHPRAFMRRERKYEKHEKHEHHPKKD